MLSIFIAMLLCSLMLLRDDAAFRLLLFRRFTALPYFDAADFLLRHY